MPQDEIPSIPSIYWQAFHRHIRKPGIALILLGQNRSRERPLDSKVWITPQHAPLVLRMVEIRALIEKIDCL
jgi:hypothetical protein